MSDQNRLMQYVQGPNNFGPLTPEQEVMLQRQAIQSGLSPADLAMGAGIGGLGGAGLFGMLASMARLGMRPALSTGALAGGIAGAQEMQMRRNGSADAEGQRGGFYGNMPSQYVQGGVNNFGPISPEQEGALRRQGISESMGPMDMLGPAGLAKLLGFGAGATLGGAAASIPSAVIGAGMLGHRPALGHGVMYGGALGGGLIGGAHGYEAVRQWQDNRDAEGQPGGFYGNMLSRY